MRIVPPISNIWHKEPQDIGEINSVQSSPFDGDDDIRAGCIQNVGQEKNKPNNINV